MTGHTLGHNHIIEIEELGRTDWRVGALVDHYPEQGFESQGGVLGWPKSTIRLLGP